MRFELPGELTSTTPNGAERERCIYINL
jgi:hypothetical protein